MLLPRAPRYLCLRTVLVACTIAGLLVAAICDTGVAMPALDDRPHHRASVAEGSQWQFNRSEACLMRKINRVRRARGKRALAWDKQIGYVARRHASAMAVNRGVWHDGAVGQKVTRWRRLGQNTGRGGGCRRLFRSFMRSSAHRPNILGRWRYMGVGTMWAGGDLYVQQLFESRDDPGNVYSYP